MATDQDSNGGELRRVLGPVDATCVVIGAIIGVGIFFTPARVASMAGSSGLTLLAWAIGGVIALMGALTFAELGGRYPRTGAQYDMLRDAYGPLPGFLFVFCNATASQGGSIAIMAIVCLQNLGLAVRGVVPGPWQVMTGSAVLILLLMTANCLGVRWGSRIQNLTVYAKVVTLLLITLLAAWHHAPEPSATAAAAATTANISPALGVGLFAALVPVLFSYGGWQHVLWIAGEVRKPRRDVPLATIAGVVLVIVVYMFANGAYLRLLGYDGLAASKTPAADAVAVVWPHVAMRIAAGAVALSAFGVLNVQFLPGPRLIYRLALDGRFFRSFARVNVRFHTPVPAILLLGGCAVLLLLAVGNEKTLDRLQTGVIFVDGFFFALTGLALIVLRRKQPHVIPSVRVPGYPVVPLLFVLGELAVLVGTYCDPAVRGAAFIGGLWIIAAAVCYYLFFAKRRATGS